MSALFKKNQSFLQPETGLIFTIDVVYDDVLFEYKNKQTTVYDYYLTTGNYYKRNDAADLELSEVELQHQLDTEDLITC